MTTFTNNFHNTEAAVRANEGETVSRAVALRVERDLCGMSDCTCDTFRGSEYRLEQADAYGDTFVVVYNN